MARSLHWWRDCRRKADPLGVRRGGMSIRHLPQRRLLSRAVRFQSRSLHAFPERGEISRRLFRAPYCFGAAASPVPFNTVTGSSHTAPSHTGGTEKPPSFAPFLIGPRSCVAKPFAYLEMSLAIARLVWLMDFRTADSTGEGKPGSGIVGRERKEEFQIVDMFSSSKEGPVLQWRRRQGS